MGECGGWGVGGGGWVLPRGSVMHIGHKQGAGRLHGQQEVAPGSPGGMLGDMAALQVLLQVFVLLLVQAAPKYEHLQSAAASR